MSGYSYYGYSYPTSKGNSEDVLGAYFKQLIAQYEAYYKQMAAQYQQALQQYAVPMTQDQVQKYNAAVKESQLKSLKDTLAQLKEYEKLVQDQVWKLESEGENAKKKETESAKEKETETTSECKTR